MFESVFFDGIGFEPRVEREEIRPNYEFPSKKMYTFDESLERIKKAGYERHMRPSEFFSLFIASLVNKATLENKLNQEQKELLSDMNGSYGEWFSMALARKGDTLICYQDPINLKFDGKNYFFEGEKLRCINEREFKIPKDIPSGKYIGANQFDDDLIEFLYGIPYAQLPKVFQQGMGWAAQLCFLPDGKIGPLCMHPWIGVLDYASLGSSRGVRFHKFDEKAYLEWLEKVSAM